MARGGKGGFAALDPDEMLDELAPEEDDEGGERREKPPDDADALISSVESQLKRLRAVVGAADEMDEDEDEDEY